MNDDVVRELTLLKELGFSHLDLSVGGWRLAVGGGDEQATQPLAVSASPNNQQPTTNNPPAVSPANRQLPTANSPAVSPANRQPPTANSSTVSPANRQPPTANSPDDLAALMAEAHNCNACRLAGTRKNVVFGVGSPNADLMFIGEAPGRDEDEQGEPFVGRAGQLLTDIIKAMKLTRDDVYIANVIKCRPPENRNPEPDELDECRPFIRRQVELIQPKVIVALGRFGLQSLTGKSYSITAVRGQWLDYNGIRLMPTFHPSYLLRTPAAKKDVWQDMKKVMAELGIAP